MRASSSLASDDQLRDAARPRVENAERTRVGGLEGALDQTCGGASRRERAAPACLQTEAFAHDTRRLASARARASARRDAPAIVRVEVSVRSRGRDGEDVILSGDVRSTRV